MCDKCVTKVHCSTPYIHITWLQDFWLWLVHQYSSQTQAHQNYLGGKSVSYHFNCAILLPFHKDSERGGQGWHSWFPSGNGHGCTGSRGWGHASMASVRQQARDWAGMASLANYCQHWVLILMIVHKPSQTLLSPGPRSSGPSRGWPSGRWGRGWGGSCVSDISSLWQIEPVI